MPEPFNLTKVKPKMIPVPEAIKREIIANPVPRANHRKTLAEIEAEKKERRAGLQKAIRDEYEGGAKQRFPLATEGLKSTKKIEKVREDLGKRKQHPAERDSFYQKSSQT